MESMLLLVIVDTTNLTCRMHWTWC